MLKNICILIFRVDVHSDSDSEEDASCDKIGTNSDAEEDVNIASKRYLHHMIHQNTLP